MSEGNNNITIGQLTETINNKMDRDGLNANTSWIFVVSKQDPTSENGYTWYCKYSDGWVEQGGLWVGSGSAPENGTIDLPITMSNANYQVLFSYNQNVDSISDWTANTSIRPLSATQLKVRKLTMYAGNISWEVKGYSAV